MLKIFCDNLSLYSINGLIYVSIQYSKLYSLDTCFVVISLSHKVIFSSHFKLLAPSHLFPTNITHILVYIHVLVPMSKI